MRVAAILSPVHAWPAVLQAARAADEAVLDAIGFWDHYHSARPDWGYVCGWSAYGAIAAATSSIRLVPMVLNTLHYDVGVIAKESSLLATASDDRFEVALGAGDWPESFSAWGRPFPAAQERIELLIETAQVLRLIWSGQPVSFDGRHIRLRDAICAPPPPVPPRIVIGAGRSRRAIDAAGDVADEINVYDEVDLIRLARETAEAASRPIDVSVFGAWDWDNWPADPKVEVARLEEAGVDRIFVSIGGEDMVRRVRELAVISGTLPT
jgi:alkanesulfonate monooxygenase SsuD/methylene tetrahydromethanopterin reductase-like flavin-dependent oxidoreductase (luciferase family)